MDNYLLFCDLWQSYLEVFLSNEWKEKSNVLNLEQNKNRVKEAFIEIINSIPNNEISTKDRNQINILVNSSLKE